MIQPPHIRYDFSKDIHVHAFVVVSHIYFHHFILSFLVLDCVSAYHRRHGFSETSEDNPSLQSTDDTYIKHKSNMYSQFKHNSMNNSHSLFMPTLPYIQHTPLSTFYCIFKPLQKRVSNSFPAVVTPCRSHTDVKYCGLQGKYRYKNVGLLWVKHEGKKTQLVTYTL